MGLPAAHGLRAAAGRLSRSPTSGRRRCAGSARGALSVNRSACWREGAEGGTCYHGSRQPPQLPLSLASLDPLGVRGPSEVRVCPGAGAGRTMRPGGGLDLGSVWAQRLRQLERRLRVSPAPRRREGRRGAGVGERAGPPRPPWRRRGERRGGQRRGSAGPPRPFPGPLCGKGVCRLKI